MRLVYIINSLSHPGGAERIISEKMNFLAALPGYDVTVVTCFQFPDSMPNVYALDGRVRQVDLAIPVHWQYHYGYPRRLWVKRRFRHQLHRALEMAVSRARADVIVGVGYELADMVCRLGYPAAKVIESHEARLYTKSDELYGQTSRLSKLYTRLYRHVYLRTIEWRADVVVALTRGDARLWHRARRVVVIPNFSTMPVSALSDGRSRRVIAVGRLEWQKGYDRLFDIWALVAGSRPGWQLDIYGDGSLHDELARRAAALRGVTLHPFTADISRCYAESAVCVLTSRFEGFSLVLLEAQRHGLPCVTFDCPFGPSDVVSDGRSGYVVSDGDIHAFARRLGWLMDHDEQRVAFGREGVAVARRFDQQAIMRQWTTLFEEVGGKETV